jgi:hypothetical protein
MHATLGQQVHQAVDDGTGAAHGRVHAPLLFQRMDQGVGAGDRKRIATDQ